VKRSGRVFRAPRNICRFPIPHPVGRGLRYLQGQIETKIIIKEYENNNKMRKRGGNIYHIDMEFETFNVISPLFPSPSLSLSPSHSSLSSLLSLSHTHTHTLSPLSLTLVVIFFLFIDMLCDFH
jgi:hypothetical protein